MSLLLETIEKHTNFTRKSEKFNIIFGDAYEFVNVLCGLMNCVECDVKINNFKLDDRFNINLDWDKQISILPLRISKQFVYFAVDYVELLNNIANFSDGTVFVNVQSNGLAFVITNCDNIIDDVYNYYVNNLYSLNSPPTQIVHHETKLSLYILDDYITYHNELLNSDGCCVVLDRYKTVFNDDEGYEGYICTVLYIRSNDDYDNRSYDVYDNRSYDVYLSIKQKINEFVSIDDNIAGDYDEDFCFVVNEVEKMFDGFIAKLYERC